MKCSLCVLLLTIGNVSVKLKISVLRRTCKKHITVYPSITVSDVHDTSVKYSGFILPCVCHRQTDRQTERERACVRPHAQVFMCLCECSVIDDRQYAQ